MAITAKIVLNDSVVAPDGYTADVAETFTEAAQTINFSRDEPVASIPDGSSEATGFDNLQTALKTWWTGNEAPALGLNPADTIKSNIILSSVELVNTAANQYLTPVLVYRVRGGIKWEKTA